MREPLARTLGATGLGIVGAVAGVALLPLLCPGLGHPPHGDPSPLLDFAVHAELFLTTFNIVVLAVLARTYVHLYRDLPNKYTRSLVLLCLALLLYAVTANPVVHLAAGFPGPPGNSPFVFIPHVFVGLAIVVGTGVADDKAIYAYMPRIIEYYLGESAILANVETHICREKEGLQYTLDHLDELVVKPVGEAGGYGITVGPRASKEELELCRQQLLDRPENYISQPMVDLSVSPTLVEEGIEPRHVDLRPFAVTGKDTWVLPGGLTRVALRRGSIIVNSSQGGGSKDTWVLE